MARQRRWLPGVMLLLLAGSAGAQEVIDVWPHPLRTPAHAAQETTFRDTPVGMVASGALLHEPVASRPDFAVLAYGAPFGRARPVPAGLPPVFMAWAQDDTIAGKAMEAFRNALEVAGNRPEVHVFAAGGHGFATTRKGAPSDHWFEEMVWWMQANGFAAGPVR